MRENTFKNKLLKRKAFTLVELLIVIAIIGILFIVLVSKVDFATDKAKATGVQTDFRSFQVALETVARENAGFNTFGWDTGDTNGDRIRNSYDIGDTNQNGRRDDDEVWVGKKAYAEEWTGIYTLIKPGTTELDMDALIALETAINANLDPELHITISSNGVISMSNDAKDPWDSSYHGYYITNAVNDNKDRGAIIIYSNGANQEFGSEHSISNGVVTVNVPNNNLYGKDDYNLAVSYTYKNGYGEVSTDKNIETVAPGVPDVTPEEPVQPEEPTVVVPGLYASGSNYQTLLYTWEQLVSMGMLSDRGLATGASSSTAANEDVIALLSGDILWPEELLSVPAYALKGCVNVTGVKLHDNISTLGNYCFSETGIVNFVVPPKVTSLKYTFFNSDALVSVDIHDNVRTFGYTFDDCDSLVEARIPEGVTVLAQTFEGCESLTTIYLPSTITKLEGAGFWNCPNLNNIYFAGTVEQWCKIDMDGWGYFGSPFSGSNATLYIDNQPLEHVVIPDTITSIEGSFYNCKSIKSVTLPEGFTEIGLYSFAYCSNLTSINFPSTLKTIKERAFVACKALKNVELNEGLETIGNGAFEDLYARERFFIPNSVKTIGSDAFRLTYFTIEWDPVNSQLETINSGAFYGCYFYNLVIPDSVTTLNGAVFNEAYYTTLHIGKGLTTLTKGSFEWGPFHDSARYLTSVTVDPANPNFVAVNNCLVDERTKTVVLGTKNTIAIPDFAENIESYAFYGCTGLTSIIIPESVKNIGYCAFNRCTNLISATIEGTSIPVVDRSNYLFGGCTKFEAIYVASSVVDTFKESEYWSIYANKIQANS